MHPHRLWSLAFLITVVCGWAVIHPAPVIGVTPVQMCTAQNVAGFPYSGLVCGGSVIDGCSPGAIYECTDGPAIEGSAIDKLHVVWTLS